MRVIILTRTPKAQDWSVLVEAAAKANRDLRKICGIWLTSLWGEGLNIDSKDVYISLLLEYLTIHVCWFSINKK